MCFRPAAVSKPIRCACGVLNAPTAAKCRKCGAELAVEVQEFECPRCGQKNPLTVAACENCGLTAEEAADYEE